MGLSFEVSINQPYTFPKLIPGSAPAGAAATLLIVLLLPLHFPHQNTNREISVRRMFSKASMKRLDIFGSCLILAASILLVFSLEEGGFQYAWNSVAIISTLTLSCLLWIAFVYWEDSIGGDHKMQEPIFPLRLVKNRLIVGMLM